MTRMSKSAKFAIYVYIFLIFKEYEVVYGLKFLRFSKKFGFSIGVGPIRAWLASFSGVGLSSVC